MSKTPRVHIIGLKTGTTIRVDEETAKRVSEWWRDERGTMAGHLTFEESAGWAWQVSRDSIEFITEQPA